MTQPISNAIIRPLNSEQEKPKCSICNSPHVITMRFIAIYGTSYQFCSDKCLKTWAFSQTPKHPSVN